MNYIQKKKKYGNNPLYKSIKKDKILRNKLYQGGKRLCN